MVFMLHQALVTVDPLYQEEPHWQEECVKLSKISELREVFAIRGVYIREAVRSVASHKHESDFNECTRVF